MDELRLAPMQPIGRWGTANEDAGTRGASLELETPRAGVCEIMAASKSFAEEPM